MATTRLYKNFTGVILPNSSVVYGAGTYTGYLIDSGLSLSQNFPTQEEILAVPPTTTAGMANDAAFLYHTLFQRETTIDGPIEGNIVMELSTNNASPAKVVLTQMTIELMKVYFDGTLETITGVVEIFPCTDVPYTIELVGSGTPTRKNVGIYFATSVSEQKIPTNAMLALRVKTYGYKSAASSSLAFYLQCNRTAADIKLSIPLVGV